MSKTAVKGRDTLADLKPEYDPRRVDLYKVNRGHPCPRHEISEGQEKNISAIVQDKNTKQVFFVTMDGTIVPVTAHAGHLGRICQVVQGILGIDRV